MGWKARVIGAEVCSRCGGKGRIFTRAGSMVCPRCQGAPQRRAVAAERADAINMLAHCWRAYRHGETGAFNLGIATRKALRAGYSVDQLHRRLGIPARLLRDVATGQGMLL